MSDRGGSKRLGIPQPQWGDNVVSADFSRGRRGASYSSTVPARAATRSPEVPVDSDLSKNSWSANLVLRTATSLTDSGRLGRGRTTFRNQALLQFDAELGTVNGLVSGSQLEPFEVQIRWRPLSPRQMDYITGEIEEHPENLRLLLAGNGPLTEISAVLFSVDQYVDSWCTCPDHGLFCKHRVCLCYALAASFSEDPTRFLAWRGLDADALLSRIRSGKRAGTSGPMTGGVEQPVTKTSGGAEPVEDVPEEEQDLYTPTQFWGDVDAIPRWEPFEVSSGLEKGDLGKRDQAIRRFSWNNVDQLRVLHTLSQCYDALTGVYIPANGEEQVFDREPWMSDPADRNGRHD